MSSRSGSSRRKPLVTRKVFDNSTDEEEDDAARNDSQKVNGDSQSEEDIPEELPEGTVVVNPEPVEEKNPTFKGPEFVSGKRKVTGNVSIDVSGLMSRVTCTACHKQINTNKKGSARRHPLLKVLICKRCRTYYDSGPIQKDKDGLDEQCRWCGEGGRLFGCDFCHNAFCRSCIIHNLGRSELMRVQNDDKWKCYVCNSKSLRSQRHECEAVLEQIKKEEQKAKNALEREKEREKNKDKKDTSSKSPAVKSGDIVKTAASSKSVDTKQSNVKTTTSRNVEVVVVGPKTPVQPKPSMKIEPQQKAPVQQQLKNLLNLAGGQQYNAQQKASPVKRIQQQKQQPRPMMSRVGFISSLDPTSITLPMLIKEFKKNITPTTIPQVLNKLMSITNSLTLLMSSIKMNIMDNNFNRPGYESLNAMTIQSRKTAVDCLVSGLELFLQELQITTVGEYVQPPPESVDIAGANGSSADMNNAGNGDDSEPEVVEIDSPAKTPKKSSLKMTMINNEIIVESDSEEEVTPVKMEVSQTDSVEKETIKGEQEMDDKISKDEGISDEAVEDKLTVEKSSKKVDKEKMDKKTEVSKDINKKKADKKSREESPKKQSNVKKEGPKKAKKSGTEDSDKVDSENTEAQLELLKELADELIKNGNKSDSESENDSEGEDNEDSQNIENGDEDETSKKGANETEDDSDSKIVSSDGSNGITNPEENSAEDKGDQKESDDEKEVEKENNDEEEEDKNRPVSSASSNAESDSDSEDSDNSGPRRRLRKRKKDEKPEKKGKGSLKIRLRLPGKTKSQKENEDKKSDRRSSHSKTEEESQESEEENKGKKGKTKKKEKESDSENFDSDLEDEIDKLAKDPKIQKKKKKSDEEEKPSKEKKKDLKGEKDKKTKGKKEEKVDSDSSEGTDNYDPEEAPDEEEEEEPMEAVDPTSDISARENSSDEDSENNEDSDDSSDSEVIINSPKKKRGKATSKKTKKSESDPDSDSDAVPKKKTRLHTKLLDAKLSESDDSDFELPRKGKGKKRRAKTDSSSQESTEVDSDVASKKKLRGKKGANQKGKGKKGKGTKRRRIKVASDSSDEKMSTEGEEEMKNEKKKKKKKKGGSDSEEDSDEEGDENGSPSKGRKQIRKIKSDKKLTDSTRKAVKAEEERRKRIAEKQKEFNNVVVEEDPSAPNKCPITKKLVFEYDKETKEPLIEVDERLITKLKPHQVEAAQFMWDCTVESVERIKKEKGAGCILAHCMGLGKTLSVITFLHTVMNHSDQTGISKALVVGPLNTVLNWQQEFQIWLSGELGEEFYEVFEISSVKQNVARADMLKHWHKNGGVMIMGYEMFRNLTQGNHCRSKKLKQIFREALVDPGPDICVCDEGHILKNDASAISKAMNQLVTLRRIVLTGTPLQNNLIEYHCMVNFVKPNLLGTRKEFCNRFVNPIVNGQCTDSSAHDVRLMKRRAHIIHEKLAGCVQRKDYSALTKFLSPKFEYVISVRLSKVQIELYQKYLDKTGSVNSVMGKGAKLFSDYQALMRIWTHPWVLKMDEVRQEKKAKWDDEDSFIEDGSMSEDESGSELSKSNDSDSDVVAISDNSSDEDSGGRKTRSSREAGSSKDTDEVVVNSKGEVVKKWTTRSRGGEGCEWEGIIKAAEEEEDRPLTTDWWADYVTEEDANRIELSGKLTLLFEILRMSEEIGDKVLVFSQSLLSLDLIEDFLEYIDKKHQEETEEKEKKRKEAEEEEKKKSDEEKDEEDKEEETKDEDKAKPEEDTPEENVFGKQWTKGADYFRMDGSTSAQQRKDLAAAFNDPENYRARLFIISTKAGGLGINLVAANRVIIFDASWNPSNDVQSVFRVYRFGQTKPVYIYRFLAQGTMEEKIYERQVTKQSLSQRVVDEHQIERHFNSHDLQVLYTFKPDRLDDPNREERPTPELPKDHMLAEMLQSHKDWICAYHKHDSLLENQIDEELTEEERKAAWKEFEDEKKGIMNNVRQQFMGMNNMPGMHPGMAPNINMNMLMQQGLRLPHMGGMPSSNMPFNQQNLLQLVQDMKTRFPHLPEDQLTARVQGVIRHIITNQYMQQQEMQKRQLEQREMQHQQQLHQIQAQIQRQQQQLNAHQRMGGHPGQMPNRR
ncbi:transcriptional regulator ATRX-like [Ylistrum balloti]|uniref:transcriptional regulator ATRX-like n=1 Tax=Ylistrum balloti TaxID=509963 RepID=UPI002905AEDB|nr:transcriptional regulator ATRX-like [Ylistrum balloti]XP_060067661.1 transcriptional regulator ATRX-like [Ylistrum balloti]